MLSVSLRVDMLCFTTVGGEGLTPNPHRGAQVRSATRAYRLLCLAPMRAVVLLFLAGCQTSYIRYVGSKASPDAARLHVAARAIAAGWKAQQRPVATSLVEVGEVAHPEAVADAPAAPELSPGGVDRYWTTDGKPMIAARAMPLASGSLLEVSSTSVAMLDRVSAGGDTYEAKDQAWSLDRFHVDTTIDAGYARSMHTDVKYRADWMVHIGHAVWARGGDGASPETRKRISIVGGIGLVATDRPAVRPELGVMFDMQRAFEPFDQRIYQSRRKSLSLSIAAPRGHAYSAVEGSVTVHVPPYGGVFARAGYEWAETKRGATYMVGARFDTVPAAAIIIGLAMYALAVAAKEKDWSIGCLRECEN
jgi:hypothetical protein